MRKLVLFSEFKGSLSFDEKFGLLARHVAQFGDFLDSGDFDEICYFTYDDKDRQKLAEIERDSAIAGRFSILTPPRILHSKAGSLIYSIVGPFIHYRAIAEASMLRTQQVSGSWTALIARLATGTPLLFRLGYPLSVRFRTEGRKVRYAVALAVEWCLVRFADHVAVTSREMQAYYGRMAPRAKITVLPNHVDIGRFTRIETYAADRPILFVGRLEPVKNIPSLVTACARLAVPLHIYGIGSLEGELRDLARSSGAAVEFRGVVPNSELARIHHDHTVYVLCSTREGMPKSLIEAMASGLICVSTPTDGARELIDDGRTGYFTEGFDADALERKLGEVLADVDPDVGRAARDFVRDNNSLERVVAAEHEIVDELVRSRRPFHPEAGMQAYRRADADPACRPPDGQDRTDFPRQGSVQPDPGHDHRAQQERGDRHGD